VLDYVNTVNGRPAFTRDDLATTSDLAGWAGAAAAVHHVELAIGGDVAPAHHRAAIELRERLYSVFGAIATDVPPRPDDVRWLTERAADALRRAELVRTDAGYEARWSHPGSESVCDSVADSAVNLLRSPIVRWVKACDGCGWLYLDTSRSHGRRWCSMNACGARHKMRRYHQRRSHAAGEP